MTDFAIHRVQKVSVERTYFKSEPKFYVTTYTVIDENEQEHRIKLFSDNPINFIDNTYEEIG